MIANKVERRDDGVFMTLKVEGKKVQRNCYYEKGVLKPHIKEGEMLIETLDGIYSIIRTH